MTTKPMCISTIRCAWSVSRPHPQLEAGYARQGRDWENALKQRAKELALMRQLGLDQTPVQPTATEDNDSEEEEEENDHAPSHTEE